jgi:hypothetical protein
MFGEARSLLVYRQTDCGNVISDAEEEHLKDGNDQLFKMNDISWKRLFQ